MLGLSRSKKGWVKRREKQTRHPRRCGSRWPETPGEGWTGRAAAWDGAHPGTCTSRGGGSATSEGRAEPRLWVKPVVCVALSPGRSPPSTSPWPPSRWWTLPASTTRGTSGASERRLSKSSATTTCTSGCRPSSTRKPSFWRWRGTERWGARAGSSARGAASQHPGSGLPLTPGVPVPCRGVTE